MKQILHAWPRDAWFVLTARALLMAVNALVMISLVLRVHDGGHGPLGNTGLMVALALPSVLTMGVAGRVADRFDSRLVLTLALTAQSAAAAALAASTDLAWTYAWALVLETGFAFASPVWMALVPRIVGDDRVQGLAGLQMLVSSLTAPLGGAAGGLLVDAYGTQSPPLAAAGVLGLILLLALAVRTRRHGATEPAASGSEQDAHGGLRLILRDPALAAVLIGGVILVLVVQGVNVVEVFLARDVLGASASAYGLSELFFAAGTLAASLLVARMKTDRRRIWGVVGGFGVTSAACVAIGFVPNFAAYLALLVVLGVSNGAANGATGPLFLLRSPEAARGRVMAALGGTFSAASVVALLLGGVVGGWLGPRLTFVVGGGLALLVVAGMGAVAVPAVRRSAATSPAAAPDADRAAQAGSVDTDQPAGRPSA